MKLRRAIDDYAVPPGRYEVLSMTTFEFTLRIDQRLPEEAEMESIYSNCRDASLLVEGGFTLIRFHREAATLQDAIRSAIADVNAAGYHVAHVDLEPDSFTTQTA